MQFKSTFQRQIVVLLGAALAGMPLCGCSQYDTDVDVSPEKGAQSLTTFTWKGHVWNVTSGGMAGVAQGSPNNVSIDANGYLHLKITNTGGTWTASELFSADKLGFGTYQWQIDAPIDRLDKNVVVGLFPYGPEVGIGADGTNEIDIEYSRWGNATGPNGDWTDYPASGKTIGELAYSFSLSSGTLSTSRFIWSKTAIQNFLIAGVQPVGSTTGLIKSWTYQPSNPSVNIPQQALPLGMNLWCFGATPSDGKNVEIVIRDFQFIPEGSTGTQYTISASTGANGSISPSGSVRVNQGAAQSFAITPNAGYSIGTVTVDGAGQGAISSYGFKDVQSAHSISATFLLSPGDGNLAPSGVGYRWSKNTSATSNANRAASSGINDGNLTAGVNLNTAGEGGTAAWEAAGVLWSSARTISSVNFINGSLDSYGNGYLEANCKLEFTTDGVTWTDSGWSMSPSYPFSSATAGKTYSFSGPVKSGVLGVRVTGQTGPSSWSWIVNELRAIGH